MTMIIPTIISIVGLIVGIPMIIHIMNVAHIDLMPLWVGLTMAAAMGCAFVFNFKRPVEGGDVE